MCFHVLRYFENSNQPHEQRKYLHIYYPPYLKKYFQFLAIHTSGKIAYTEMYRTKKINQSIFKSS